MRIIVRAGVFLLVSGIILLVSCNGCGKKKIEIKWEDKQLEKILESKPFNNDLEECEEFEDDDEIWWCNA